MDGIRAECTQASEDMVRVLGRFYSAEGREITRVSAQSN